MSRPLENLIGQTFGFLTVVAGPFRSPRNKEKTRFEHAWKCICKCGRYWFATNSHLKSKHVTSCGCQSSRLKTGRKPKKEKVTA